MTGAPSRDGLSSQAMEPQASPAEPSIPSAFTPGPWSLCPDNYVAERSGYGICKVPEHSGLSREAKDANARLIAAAPELYEALAIIAANSDIIPDPAFDGASDCYAVPLEDIENACRIIAKARGGTL